MWEIVILAFVFLICQLLWQARKIIAYRFYKYMKIDFIAVVDTEQNEFSHLVVFVRGVSVDAYYGDWDNEMLLKKIEDMKLKHGITKVIW